MGDKADQEPPFPLTDVDKWVLSQTDEEFKRHNWDELREILGAWYIFHGPLARLLTVSQMQMTSPFLSGSRQTCEDTWTGRQRRRPSTDP